MIRRLVVAGDSNSFGAETIQDGDCDNPKNIYNAYGYFLSKLLNSEYINLSKSGASNTDIAMQVLHFFKDPENFVLRKNTLVIVGWTETSRTKLKDNIAINYYTLKYYLEIIKSKIKNSFLNDLILKKYSNIDPKGEYGKFVLEHILTSEHNNTKDMMSWVAIDNYLKRLEIPYFTFPTCYTFLDNSYFDLKEMLNPNNNIFNFSIPKIILNLKSPFSKGEAKLMLGKFFRGLLTDFDFMEEYKKYGLAKNKHLKTPAHKKFALWLHDELLRREII